MTPKLLQRMMSVPGAGLIALLLILSGCSNAPSPQPVHASAEPVIPDHTAFAGISCLNYHELDRPAPVIDTATGAAVIHGGGQDCGQCHTAGGASWRIFTAFSHSPAPAAWWAPSGPPSGSSLGSPSGRTRVGPMLWARCRVIPTWSCHQHRRSSWQSALHLL